MRILDGIMKMWYDATDVAYNDEAVITSEVGGKDFDLINLSGNIQSVELINPHKVVVNKLQIIDITLVREDYPETMEIIVKTKDSVLPTINSNVVGYLPKLDLTVEGVTLNPHATALAQQLILASKDYKLHRFTFENYVNSVFNEAKEDVLVEYEIYHLLKGVRADTAIKTLKALTSEPK